jgi:hypothetical protein
VNYQFIPVIFMLLVLAISPSSLAFSSTSSNSAGDNDDFLNIREATIGADSGEMSAFLETHGHIPTNGDGGAFGYGVLTDEGLDAVVVSTTHAGVQDSEEQSNASDPVWHNHYVTLSQDSDNCGNDSKVESITFESPGEVDIRDDNADLTKLPSSFSGTDALSGADLTIKPGTSVKDVVSFKLAPQFNDNGELEAVCVTNLQSAENIVFDNNNGNSNSDSSNDDSSSSSSNDDSSEASQGIRQSQISTQLGVCVSGDGTFFSCNNLSDQSQTNTGNNAAAQSGGSDDDDDDDNTANQGIDQAQSSDQNALCVSGSGTFDSCNNFNAQNQQNSGNNALAQQDGSGSGGNSANQGIGQSQSSNQGNDVVSGGNTAGSGNNANIQSQTNTGNNAAAQKGGR